MGQNEDHIGQENEDPSRTLDAGKPLYELGNDPCVECRLK